MSLLRRLLDALLRLFGREGGQQPPRRLQDAAEPATGPEHDLGPDDEPTDPGDDAEGDPMPQPMAIVLAKIPVFARPDTSSDKLGTVAEGTALPYLGQKTDGDTTWFNVTYQEPDAWIVAVSGKTYAVLDEPVPPGGPWDVLLEVACDPDIAAAPYGFSPGRTGGAQVPNPEGWSWPRSQYNNCITFAAEAVQLARHALGLGGAMSRDDWATICCWEGYGDQGLPLVAHRWGIGSEPLDIGGASSWSGELEPGWYGFQGWNAGADGRLDTDDDLGHGGFLRVVEADQILFLESRGRAAGGSLDGQDGDGSRTTEPRNARDWTPGQWPAVRTPYTLAKLRATYAKLYITKLGDEVLAVA